MGVDKITISGKTRLAQECANLDPAEEQALAEEGFAAEVSLDPDMLNEYDFRGGRRGVYAERYAQGTNLVVLAPDVAELPCVETHG